MSKLLKQYASLLGALAVAAAMIYCLPAGV